MGARSTHGVRLGEFDITSVGGASRRRACSADQHEYRFQQSSQLTIHGGSIPRRRFEETHLAPGKPD
jgi:hypothetical protein